MNSNYIKKRQMYFDFIENMGIKITSKSEFQFESLYCYDYMHSTSDIKAWYSNLVVNSKMKVEEIPLNNCRNWIWDKDQSYLMHSSGEFYQVKGYRVSETENREVVQGWDQPLLVQEGYDGGILGLIRKRFNGVPHYLLDAKEEPGNYNKVQLTSTIQATFSNIKKAHHGNGPAYSDIFLNPEKYPVTTILDQWTSEDGGRLYNKRNRSMLLEVEEEKDFKLLSDRFIWVTLNQIKTLIREENAIIAPHVRGIVSGL